MTAIPKKLRVPDLVQMKKRGERIVMLTAYDATMARLFDQAGVDVILDDRDERAGVKFKDADLVGIPYRINIGRGVVEGKVELVDRLRLTNEEHSLDHIATHLSNLLLQAKLDPVDRIKL